MGRVNSVLLCLGALTAAVEVHGQTASGQTAASPTISERQMESAQKMEAAAALQRKAAQAQTAPAPDDSFFSAGWAAPSMLPPLPPGCPSMQESEFEPLIREAAERHQLNPNLIKAVMRQESGNKPCVVSEKGAMGLMQIMPETAETMKTKDPFDPAQNIEAGARYLKDMLKRFKGDVRLALAAYNAGPEKVDGPTPAVPDIAETRDYVESITAALHGEAPETTAKTTTAKPTP